MLQCSPNLLCPSFVPSFPLFPCLSLHVPSSPALFPFICLPPPPCLHHCCSLPLFARASAAALPKLKMRGSISDLGAFCVFSSRESQPDNTKKQKIKMQMMSWSSAALADSLLNLFGALLHLQQIHVQRCIPQEWGSKYGFLTV